MISNKNIAIFGYGIEGVSAANYFGRKNKIIIIDDKAEEDVDSKIKEKLIVKVENYYGGQYPKNLKIDLIVRSPGFRPNDPRISHYLSRGGILTTATNIFFENCPCKIIGVTGTKGKGTTSTLLYKILKNSKKDVYLAGNIGTSMLSILEKVKETSIVILELSSFQLFDIKYSPWIAVVLMITSEHLDWHINQEEYLKAKQNIVKFQKSEDYAVINNDFKNSTDLEDKTKAKVFQFSTKHQKAKVYIDNDKIFLSKSSASIIDISKIRLPGRHNLQNVCAAIQTAELLNIPKAQYIKVLETFEGLVHRLQLVRETKGVRYINDSYSTIPDTAIAALSAFDANKIIILGGSSKKSDFSPLGQYIGNDKSIKAVILIGEEAENIKKSIQKNNQYRGKIVEGLKSMEQIVRKASSLASHGDYVILSPACASFDMFKNYEDRGNQFIKIVNKLP